MSKKKQFFGTDGIRGPANVGKMTPDNVMRFGMAAGKYFRNGGTRRHSVVIGKDTRLSGYMIEPALVAGFASVGMDVKLSGPIPTSGVALMTTRLRADLGVMITASHNEFSDNGIKLFGPDGRKLSDQAEFDIESFMDQKWKEGLAVSEELGRVRRYEDFQARYIEIVKSTFPKNMRLSGLKIVIDCANGAAYKTAPDTLWELGADEVIPIGVTPNMSNLGLERFIQDQNLNFIRTAVGDRHVAARMRADGYNVGGEQSGHLLMTDFSPTGDGTVAALQVLAEIIRSGKPASEVLKLFDPVPQLLKNVRYSGVSPMDHPEVLSAIEDARAMFGNSGRVLVRASGTEPLIRVMAEGDDSAQVEKVTSDLASFIEKIAA